jgi:hypothetical protein
MNPFFKPFIVQRSDGSKGYNYRALGYLALGVCVLTLLVDFFVTHGPLFPPHR